MNGEKAAFERLRKYIEDNTINFEIVSMSQPSPIFEGERDFFSYHLSNGCNMRSGKVKCLK